MSLAKKYALIDLHLHLDGSISLSSARALAKMQGIELDDDDKALLSRLTVGEDCKDLNEYLEKFDVIKNGLLLGSLLHRLECLYQLSQVVLEVVTQEHHFLFSSH